MRVGNDSRSCLRSFFRLRDHNYALAQIITASAVARSICVSLAAAPCRAANGRRIFESHESHGVHTRLMALFFFGMVYYKSIPFRQNVSPIIALSQERRSELARSDLWLPPTRNSSKPGNRTNAAKSKRPSRCTLAFCNVNPITRMRGAIWGSHSMTNAFMPKQSKRTNVRLPCSPTFRSRSTTWGIHCGISAKWPSRTPRFRRRSISNPVTSTRFGTEAHCTHGPAESI